MKDDRTVEFWGVVQAIGDPGPVVRNDDIRRRGNANLVCEPTTQAEPEHAGTAVGLGHSAHVFQCGYRIVDGTIREEPVVLERR